MGANLLEMMASVFTARYELDLLLMKIELAFEGSRSDLLRQILS
jgi:hypothetical protein